MSVTLAETYREHVTNQPVILIFKLSKRTRYVVYAMQDGTHMRLGCSIIQPGVKHHAGCCGQYPCGEQNPPATFERCYVGICHGCRLSFGSDIPPECDVPSV